MINQKIRIDIEEEFSNIKTSLQPYLSGNFNISETKQFLQAHVPKEVIYRSEVLLDTLLNYLMKDARKKIQNSDVKLKNAFFNENFRKRIHEWSIKLENKLELDPETINYTPDPRRAQGLVASGITFVIGTTMTVTLASSVIETIVAGVVTVLLSAFAFKLAFDNATLKARDIVKADIDLYLEEAQNQVFYWLSKVEKAFNDNLNNFCSENGFKVEKDND